jgi:hypothetical protein
VVFRSSATVSAPPAKTISATTIAAATRHRVLRRDSHSCTVVPATLPQDGTTSGAGC